jgi:hypothetical protein
VAGATEIQREAGQTSASKQARCRASSSHDLNGMRRCRHNLQNALWASYRRFPGISVRRNG